MVEITRHFTTSCFIVYKNKVLLHQHKKLNLLLPPGGHIERDELPHEAVLKEINEESGLNVELYNSNKKLELKDSIDLNRGEHLNLHNINEFHQHIDFIFYAKALDDRLKPKKGESKELYWFSKDEIENSTCIKSNVKVYALEALEKLKE